MGVNGKQRYLIKMRCLITAGPTREYIDPVRFLSNPSSGKMGFALAEAALEIGWTVELVSGPSTLVEPSEVIRYPVETGDEMFDAVDALFDACDVFISTAAVMDFRPVQRFEQKVKKNEASLTIELEPTRDILATMSARKKDQLMVGFAAESHDVEKFACEKLIKKDLDYVVGNQITGPDTAFANDDNSVVLIDRAGTMRIFERTGKHALARRLITIFRDDVISAK